MPTYANTDELDKLLARKEAEIRKWYGKYQVAFHDIRRITLERETLKYELEKLKDKLAARADNPKDKSPC